MSGLLILDDDPDVALAARLGVEMPVAGVVAALVEARLTVPEAMRDLLDRPLRAE